MNELEKIVNNKRVIVVGPSPHLESTGMGDFIDSYDIICRLNEVFPTDLEKDYGSRTDIVFWNLATNSLNGMKQMILEEKKKSEEIKLVVCPRYSKHVEPGAYHLKNINTNNDVFKNYQSLGLKNNFFHIGDDENQKLERDIGCHPTTGTLALCMLMDCDFEQLYIAGMSFYQTDRKYNLAAQKTLTNANGGVIPASCFNPRGQCPGHNIPKEVDYLRNKVANCKHTKGKNISGDYYFGKTIE